MTTAIVTVEGVLAAGDDLRNAQPTKWAKPLYDGMRSQFNIILFSAATDEIAKWWLHREGIRTWATLLCWPPNGALIYPRWRVEQVRGFLADGWEIAFCLDPNTEVLKAVADLGVITLAMSYPTNHLGWRDHTTAPRSWTDVVDTVEMSQGD